MTTGRTTPPPSWANDLCQPLPLAAVGLLLLNDHWLKQAELLPGSVTGKLSDVAGLFFFPILLVVLSRGMLLALGRPPLARSRWLPAIAVVTTMIGFSLVKLSPAVNQLVAASWGVILIDPSDLYALPLALLAWSWMTSREPTVGATPGFGPRLAIAFAAFASVATPAPRFPRNYPAWQITGGAEQTTECGTTRAWVSKSGKRGVGLTVELPAGSCQLLLSTAALQLGDGTRVVATPVRPEAKAGYLYLPFMFDNNDKWNRKVRDGLFVLELVASGKQLRWEMPAVHQLDGYHVDSYGDRRGKWRAR